MTAGGTQILLHYSVTDKAGTAQYGLANSICHNRNVLYENTISFKFSSSLVSQICHLESTASSRLLHSALEAEGIFTIKGLEYIQSSIEGDFPSGVGCYVSGVKGLVVGNGIRKVDRRSYK